jgi:hypothetical protein
VSSTPWTKATKSGGTGTECVEVRRHQDTIQVRDSKDPQGPILTFTLAEWDAFLDGAVKGEFNF